MIKKVHYFLSPIVMLITLVAVLIIQVDSVHADTLTAEGLSAEDAKVTLDGKKVTGNTDRYQSYTVSYNWSIADNIEVKDGDTINFELPSNVQIVGQTGINVSIKNGSGMAVGKATIKPGATTGTITITKAENLRKYSRTGTLEFEANGKTTYSSHSWMINKTGTTTKINGKNYITWAIAYNPNAKKLNNVVLTDTLGAGQDYVKGSLEVQTGNFDKDNKFTKIRTTTAKVSQKGQTLTIDLGNISTGIYLTYRTELNEKATSKITNNVADNSGNKSDAGVVEVVKSDKQGTSTEKTTEKNDVNSTMPKSSVTNKSNKKSINSTSNPHGITTTTIRTTTKPESEDSDLTTTTYNANANKTLPQTGESNGSLLIQVGALLATLGAIIGSAVLYKKN